jgi:hypothetical protein
MRIGLILVLILLSATAFSSAERYCHEDNCFTNRGYVNLNGEDLHIYYNSLFTIGENWFIVFHITGTDTDYDIGLSFEDGNSKSLRILGGSSNYTDSVSFSGSTFVSEKFDFDLNLTITQSQDGTVVANSTFSIDINAPSDDDMFYLWGGMTVFWVAIGAYVLYLSSKVGELRNKVEEIGK